MELGMAVLPWLCPLLCPVCLLRHMLVALPIILRGLASIYPGQQGLQQGSEGPHALQLRLVQLGCNQAPHDSPMFQCARASP